MNALKKKFFYYALQQNPLTLYAASGSIIVAIILIAWYFFYLPLTLEIDRLAQLQTMQANQIQLYYKIEKEKKEVQKSVALLQSDIKNFASTETANQVMQDIMADLVKAATKYGIKVITCRRCKATDGGWCKTNEINFHAHGSLSNIISFLQSIKKNKKLLKISSVSVAQKNPNEYDLQLALEHLYFCAL